MQPYSFDHFLQWHMWWITSLSAEPQSYSGWSIWVSMVMIGDACNHMPELSVARKLLSCLADIVSCPTDNSSIFLCDCSVSGFYNLLQCFRWSVCLLNFFPAGNTFNKMAKSVASSKSEAKWCLGKGRRKAAEAEKVKGASCVVLLIPIQVFWLVMSLMRLDAIGSETCPLSKYWWGFLWRCHKIPK